MFHDTPYSITDFWTRRMKNYAERDFSQFGTLAITTLVTLFNTRNQFSTLHFYFTIQLVIYFGLQTVTKYLLKVDNINLRSIRYDIVFFSVVGWKIKG